ncbi:3-methyl-2-oxobutanoate hydroxymethyltransferase [Psychrobacter sp. FDAARGOS_221]|uniref:3-methyl-2-oxobutanoate hydroxymethyltransferase n=1 Tax=Psychrobacter sp. FDAARGOS_221 TaxID=1975705 RepID=UPI000BB560F5|nr:3-methyl-2-oxobutanoate hydroxymethyltransferase [Psychrobacter sp. FDAARGOS_221]PNK61028.1 3-methyl-2-oxobutanoate hydroxymethyltransferase [Psychrobacter sp. FDAARGOS_221]
MITLSTLKKYKKEGRKFSCLTCYDAMFAKMMQNAQIDTILIGDSLGMVVQGHDSTLPVTVDDMAYHTGNVARSNEHALILADLPFMSYVTLEDAIANTRQIMQAGAHVIKIEGGAELADTVAALTAAGAPICVHLGLTPQSVNVFGGYKVQGKSEDSAAKLMADVRAVVDAGAAIILLECVPAALAKQVTEAVDVPVIGIGAGADTDGQVLVMHDMLGVTHGRTARFVHDFLTDERNQQGERVGSVEGAFALYHQSVMEGSYPGPEHQFN